MKNFNEWVELKELKPEDMGSSLRDECPDDFDGSKEYAMKNQWLERCIQIAQENKKDAGDVDWNELAVKYNQGLTPEKAMNKDDKQEKHACEVCGSPATSHNRGITGQGSEEWDTQCSNPNCPTNKDRNQLSSFV